MLSVAATELVAQQESGVSEAEAVQEALVYVLQGHDRSSEPRKKEPRARITGYATADCPQGEDEFEAHEVNPATGSLIFAEAPTQLAADAAAGTFLRAMQLSAVDRSMHDKAEAKIRRAMRRTLPAVIRGAQTVLGERRQALESGYTSGQIVDGKLVYQVAEVWGTLPTMYVYSRGTGECVRLTEPSGVHALPDGQNIILMGNTPETDHNLPDLEIVGEHIRTALSEADPTAGDASTGAPLQAPDPQDVANHLANSLQETLYGADRSGTLVASIVEVAPWVDRRGKWNRRADALRGPSWLATNLLVRFTSKFEGQEPQQVYETNSRAGQRGRIAARLTNAIFDGSIVAGGYLLVRAFLAATHIAHLPSIGQLASEVMHQRTDNTTARSNTHPLVARGSTSKAGAAPVVTTTPEAKPTTAPPLTAPTANAKPPTVPPVASIEPKAAFPESYTAHWSDPANNGRASNATNITLQDFHAQADAAGLSESDTATLKNALDHDQTAIDGGINAFDHDTHDPDNLAVGRHPLKYVIDRTTYSTIDLNAYSKHTVADTIQRLGLHAVQRPTPPPAPTLIPPASGGPPVAVLPITPVERPGFPMPRIRPEMYLMGAGGAAVLAAGALAIKKKRKKKWYVTDVSAIPDDKSGRSRRLVIRHRMPQALDQQSSGHFTRAPFTVDEWLSRRGEAPLPSDSGARQRVHSLRTITAANRQIRSYGSDD